ncbi:MAG TPA: HAMP domain-containing sensor histidine kinase, partial [Anaerolineales bacterium]|nr:HAMP domain-containing sensor histidine kinase [Anaerolineales bacterium]
LERETLDRAITQQIVGLHAALQESNRTLQQRVTERTKELRHALERVTEINELKANLISNISHELRTPLAHIKGYVELFVAGQLGDLTDEQSEAMQVTLRATNRLGGLIGDLIEFSTASREGITLHLQPISVPELIDGVLQRSNEKAIKAGVALETTLEKDLPDLQIDPERLSWAIFQLVDNGIKFTPSGGKVSVEVGKNDLGIHFMVSDTGIGIPEDRIEEIFEPFHQLDGSSTRRYGGTGLGLALVKMIVDAHGADLAVTSQEGQGTRFGFIIPSTSGNK